MNSIPFSKLSGKSSCDVYYERLCHEGILSLYKRHKPDGKINEGKNGTALVQCPNHAPDNNPSCSVDTQNNLFHCHACGASGNIVNLLQLFTGKTGIDAYIQHFGSVPRQFPVKSAVKNASVKTNGKVRVIYYYYSEILRVVRTETYTDGTFKERINKTFRTEYLINGAWNTYYSHSKTAMEQLGIKLEAAVYGDKESEILVINEGEKCVDIFRSYGIPACCIHSTHKLKPLAALQLLKELNPNLMIILAIDNDSAGDKFLEVYGDACRQLEINYRVIKWKDYEIPPGGDIAEFMEGRTKQDLLRVLENACQQPAGLYLGNQQQLTKSQKSDEISQLKQLADQLIDAADSAIQIACLENKLDKQEQELLHKLIKEARQSESAATILEHSLAIPELRLSVLLPDVPLREILINFARKLGIPDSAIVMAFLATVSSRCQVGTSLTLQKSSDQSVPPWIYSVLVGEPGTGKTPVINALSTKPLLLLQSEMDIEYQQKLSQYEADLKEFNNLTKEQKLESATPKIPVRQPAFISDATTEAITQLMDQHPLHAVFLLVDEFANLILSRGKYSKGSNCDAQFFNSVFSGQVPIIARKSTGVIGSGKGGAVILGGTQPELLKQLFEKSSPESGEWARYWFCSIPESTYFVDCESDSATNIDFSPYLASVYKRISNCDAKKYSLSKDAYRLWGQKFNDFKIKKGKCSQPYLRHVYAKANEMIGRFSLVIHLAQYALLEIEPPEQVTLDTVSKAVLITEHYIAESAKAFSNMDTESQLFNCLRELLESQGRISYGAFLSRFSGNKRSIVTNQFSLWAQLLETYGLAVKQKEKRGYSLIYQQPKIQQLPAPAPIEQPKIQQQLPAPAPIEQPKIQQQQPPAPIEQVQQPKRMVQEQPKRMVQEQPKRMVQEQPPAPIEQVQQPKILVQEQSPAPISKIHIYYFQQSESYSLECYFGNEIAVLGETKTIEELLKYLPNYRGVAECFVLSQDKTTIFETIVSPAFIPELWTEQICSWFNAKKYAIA